MRTKGGSSNFLDVGSHPSHNHAVYGYGNVDLELGANSGASRLYLKANGSVGIKTRNPSDDIGMRGDVSISGALTVGDPANVSSGFDGYADVYVENDAEVGGDISLGGNLTISQLTSPTGAAYYAVVKSDGTLGRSADYYGGGGGSGSSEWSDDGTTLTTTSAHRNVSVSGSLSVEGNLELSATSGTSMGYILQGAETLLHTFGGSSNIYLGVGCGGTIQPDSDYNTGVGFEALSSLSATAIHNTGIGYRANYGLTMGDYNTAVGSQAHDSTNFGSRNTAVGYNALTGPNAAEDDNTAIGYNTMTSASGTPEYNVAVGSNAGSGLREDYNVAIGYQTMDAVGTDGSYNTAVGAQSQTGVVDGDNNTSLGASSLAAVTTGNNNTAIGYEAGNSVATGDANVFLGYQAGSSETGSNKLYIDNSNTNVPLIGGDFSINQVSISGSLSISDDVTISGKLFGGSPVKVADPLAIGSPYDETAPFYFDPATGDLSITGDLSVGGTILGTLSGGSGSSEWTDDTETLSTTDLGRHVSMSGNLSVDGNLSVADTFFVHKNGRVGIGTDNPQATLNIVGFNNDVYHDMYASGSVGNKGDYEFRRARGTEKSPEVVTADDQLGSIRWHGWDGNSFQSSAGAQILGCVDGTVIDGGMPTRLEFLTSASGTESPVRRMTIKQSGRIGIGCIYPSGILEVSAGGGSTDPLLVSSDEYENGDLFIVKNSGKVGIGTRTPTTELDVLGDMSISGSLSVGDPANITASLISSDGDMYVENDVEIGGSMSVGQSLTVGGSLLIPLGTSPSLAADGHLALETDVNTLNIQLGDGTNIPANTDVSMPLIQQKDVTIMEPDNVQTVSDALPMLAIDNYNYPNGIVLVAVRVTTSANSAISIVFEEWETPTGGSVSDLETVTLSGAEAEKTVVRADIDDTVVASGNYIFLDLDTTDVNWVKITIWYYVVD